MEAYPESVSILVVCDGNVCRSPSAQFVINERIPQARVESAGMHARTGEYICDVVARSISDHSPDGARFASGFRSRRLEEVDIGSFDLALTATAKLRADLTRSNPELRDRFFTLREAAGILAHSDNVETDDEGTSTLAVFMNRLRGFSPLDAAVPGSLRKKMLSPLDIPDAHTESPKSHRAIVAISMDTADIIGEALSRRPIG